MRLRPVAALLLLLPFSASVLADDLSKAIAKDYQNHLAPLFVHFHQHPELSHMEVQTAARIAEELKAAGFTVHSGFSKTGLVAILKNGPGPLVMMRADMDALPVEEKSGLPYASKVTSKDWDGNTVPVMHACGHDVHITSLVGTARQMAAMKSKWSGTLMLVGQPAEERSGGASGMMQDGIYQKFGTPDYALAFHVSSEIEAGKIVATEGAAYSGVDSVDIIVKGVGAHGASPHRGKDPIVLASQIVLALQTIISREIAPKEAGVITVGSFHAGTKHNIIPDQAVLQLTVRNDNESTRAQLLAAIKRVAENMGRVAGLPEDKLPQVIIREDSYPPTVNNVQLAQRLKKAWAAKMGRDIFDEKYRRLGMGAEDFSFFTTKPYIPSVYFQVGGTPAADFVTEQQGGPAVPSHHSPLFKISPEPAIRTGVEATVHALLDLMPVNKKQ